MIHEKMKVQRESAGTRKQQQPQRQQQPQQSRLQQQQQDQVGTLSACDDRPEEQQQRQAHKSMPSLVRHHTAVPKRFLGISYVTSDGRASSAQEHMQPGRQSWNEYRYHTVVPTSQLHKSMRARDEQHHKHTTRRAFLEYDRARGSKKLKTLQSIFYYFAFIFRSSSYVSVLSKISPLLKTRFNLSLV